jgi:hypothetical protein
MIIGNFQVHSVLKAYSQQLSVRSRSSKTKIVKDTTQKDEVTLSQEGKKMLIVDKITKEIVSQLTNGSERSHTGREVLAQLSQEFGRPLDVDTDNGNGIAFKVLNEKGDEVTQYLSSAENEELKKKLFDIAQSMVYANSI